MDQHDQPATARRASTADGTAGPAGGFAGVAQALAAVRAGLDYLAAADPAGLTGAEQADCLRGLAAAESVHLAATARMLAAFDAAGSYAADGQAGAKAWLRWQTRITRPAAGAAIGWMRRLAAHPPVAGALAAADLSPSWARRICDWTSQLPEPARPGADAILAGAAAAGCELDDLAALFEEIRARTAVPDTDGDSDRFGRRHLHLDRHFGGHASLSGELTPQAAAALEAVLDSLGKKAGPEDTRTKDQRDHDALEEGCRLLIASGCLPEVAGQPVHIELHMTLDQLLGHADCDPALAAAITATGTPIPPGAACDAAITPILTGTIDHDLADELAARYLASLPDNSGQDGSGAGGRALRAARQLTIADAVRLLSGPAGLAAWLRTSALAGPPATISMPLDIGRTASIVPPHLRRAVARRDKRCRFPGCDRRPRACQVHHLVPWSEGGDTSLCNCCLVCPFHHLIVIHRWHWRLTLNPDGTTTATSPDGRTLHSHAPPTAA